MNKRKTGSEKEETAAAYIMSSGALILERNYLTRMGEIDLIARDEGAICFIEVKYRKTAGSGHPAEAVDHRKQFKICRVADHYRMMKRLRDDIPYRFDVVSIIGDEIFWYKNAFEYIPL
jgi:putative endonuclease